MYLARKQHLNHPVRLRRRTRRGRLPRHAGSALARNRTWLWRTWPSRACRPCTTAVSHFCFSWSEKSSKDLFRHSLYGGVVDTRYALPHALPEDEIIRQNDCQ